MKSYKVYLIDLCFPIRCDSELFETRGDEKVENTIEIKKPKCEEYVFQEIRLSQLKETQDMEIVEGTRGELVYIYKERKIPLCRA